VLNVGIALAHLDVESQVVALGGGATRELADADLARLGVARRWVDARHPTRICTTLVEPDGRITELVENAGPAAPEELAAFRDGYAATVATAQTAVLIGSLPEGTPSDYYRRLLEATPCPAVLDARGPELFSALAARPFCVKPNREELAKTVGRSLDSPGALHAAMRELNERGAEWVVVTDGPRAVWASSAERLLKVEPPSVSVVNPIASGDCLAAGLAWGIAEGLNFADALRRGVAAASENCRTLLPGRLDRQRVLAAAEGIVVETM
jgi:tagatose 6-phosphate kinase